MTTTRIDAQTGDCTVLTFKEGLLSAIAHDLRIRVERFSIEIDASTLAVRATFDPSSLRVLGAVKDGALAPMSPGDCAKIERSIADEVLHPKKHPEIGFTSTAVTPQGGGYRVEGELSLHGAKRPIAFDARKDGDRLTAEIPIHQPDFGVRPFSAMLGALKIKPDVTVRVSFSGPQIGAST